MNKPIIRFLEDSLLINGDVLVFGDVHIGYESRFRAQIRSQKELLCAKVDRIFNLLKQEGIIVKKIVILGDLKDQFGGISDDEWRDGLSFIDYLLGKLVHVNNRHKLVVIAGNHDLVLAPILAKRHVPLKNSYSIRNVCFMHGDRALDCEKREVVIIGHLHPTIELADEYKHERYRCFLRGRWKGKETYILPSFNEQSPGFVLNTLRERGKDFGIVDARSLERFSVIVYNEKEDSVHDFGVLKRFL